MNALISGSTPWKAIGLVAFVRDRSFDDQNERPPCLAFGRFAEGADELIPVFVREKGIVELNLRSPRQAAGNDVFDAGLRGASHRDGVSVATETSGQPQNIDRIDRACAAGFGTRFGTWRFPIDASQRLES